MTPAVGITGGIGAGKSTVAKFFQLLEIPVYLADDRAKWLMSFDPTVKDAIIGLFGEKAYHNERLDRRFVASKVFGNQALLNQLNTIVHPAVQQDFSLWLSKQKSPYALKEAALLFETGSYKRLSSTIHVTASEELRISRVLKRDPERTKEEITGIMGKQWPEKEKIALASYVIENESQLLIPQILAIDKQLRIGLSV
jgi:dephospho-CoA kinase